MLHIDQQMARTDTMVKPASVPARGTTSSKADDGIALAG